MKITHIITSLNSGGAEKVLYNIISRDRRNEHEVICLLYDAFYYKKYEKMGVKVSTLSKGKFGIVKGYTLLLTLLKESQPDIVQTWMFHANLIGGVAAKQIGIKKIFWAVRGPNNRELYSFKTKVVIFLSGLLSIFIPTVSVYNSAYSLAGFKKIFFGKKRIIYNGFINPQVKNFFEKDKEGEDVFQLGMIARFDAFKDHKNFIMALSILKRKNILFKCLMIGRGIDHNNYELNTLISNADLNDEIILLGEMESTQEYIEKLDCHVLSSLDESFPNVVGEAMANGIPCIATDVGDIKYLIGKTGWIVPKSNPYKLVKAIEDARMEKFEKSQDWIIRKNECKKHIQTNFSIEKMLSEFNEVWNMN